MPRATIGNLIEFGEGLERVEMMLPLDLCRHRSLTIFVEKLFHSRTERFVRKTVDPEQLEGTIL